MKKILVLAFALTFILCGCGNNTVSDGRNYFGGEGSFRYWDNCSDVWEDNNNIYFYGLPNYTKFNKNTKSFAVACPMPGCSHDSPDCRVYGRRFVAFQGELIMLENEKIHKEDGTIYLKGHLYRCGADNREKVFDNILPDTLNENIKKGKDDGLGFAMACGDYLVLYNGVYSYMLDRDFNIKCTILDMGSAPRVFFVNNEYYYIDNLNRLIKLNIDTGKGEPVELDGMKITEGETDGVAIWFSNDLMELCSFVPQNGEIKKHAENAVKLQLAGDYVMYFDYDTGDDLLLKISDGSTKNISNSDYFYSQLAYADGKYYLTCMALNDDTQRIVEFDENINKTAEYLFED